MLCNKCGINEATHFMEKNINGKVTKLALCSECAKKSKEFKFDPFEGFHGFDVFDNLFGFPQIGSGKLSSKTDKKRCTLCASTFDDIVNAGKVGCSKCYEVFAKELAPTVKRIHGTRRHIGRRPGIKQNDIDSTDDGKKADPEARVRSLKKELEEAVKAENYERAAELRDEIRSAEGE